MVTLMVPGTSLHILASVSLKQKLLVDPIAAMKSLYPASASDQRTRLYHLNLNDDNFLSGTSTYLEIKYFVIKIVPLLAF